MLADISVWKPVAQPIARATDYLDLVRLQADLLLQLPKHGLFRRLTIVDPALRKLPGILTHTAAPEQPALLVAEDNANIGSKTVRINQGNTLYIFSIITFDFFIIPIGQQDKRNISLCL